MIDLSLLPDGGVGWLDASGESSDIVISTRVRLARNLEGYAFSGRARDGERLPYKLLQEVFRHAVPSKRDQTPSIRIQQVGACSISSDDVGDRSGDPADSLLTIKGGIDGVADFE